MNRTGGRWATGVGDVARILRPALLVAATLPGVGFSSTGPAAQEPIPLTLAEALDRAGQANPDLQAVRARAGAAVAQAEATAGSLWPRLTLASELFRTDTPARVFASRLNRGEFTAEDFAIDRLNHPPALSHLTSSVTLEAPLDAFGKLRSRHGADAADARSAGALLEEAAQDLRLRVLESYRRLALAQAAVSATARAVDGARAREADVEAQVAAGSALEAERLRARARRRQREADLAERRGELRALQASLARLLGAPAGTEYAPIDGVGTVPAPASSADWMARALASRGAVQAARERVASARARERAEGRSGLPDLAAYGLLQDDRGVFTEGQLSGAVGVSLRWSVFDRARSRRQAATTSLRQAAEAEARAAEDQVRLEVELASRRLEAARERSAAASGGAEEGREALRVVQERRRAGRATLTDELETEAASLAAELDELRAAAEAAVAEAALRRAAGEL
jgi:outer membrane protein